MPAKARIAIAANPPVTRPLVIVAQDPSVKVGRRILRAAVHVPAEDTEHGPWGHRVQVVDYDVSNNHFYPPLAKEEYAFSRGEWRDPFRRVTDRQIHGNRHFRAQNVYALVMRTLARFESALGRPISWPFQSHHLKLIPAGVAEANAYYSRSEEALVFGYFPSARDATRLVFTSLSHDIVVHETAHALLDALREYFSAPASPDQAAFHEGFADIVALLSVFSVPDVAEHLLDLSFRKRGKHLPALLRPSDIATDQLRRSGLLNLAEEVGKESSAFRVNALRESAKLDPSPDYYRRPRKHPDYLEAHQRGEILVAAMLDAFLTIWRSRFQDGRTGKTRSMSRQDFVAEGAAVADYLLTMAIRAIDYTPPIYLQFGDFLSALLTADAELRPAEVQFAYRESLRKRFRAFGIVPSARDVGQRGVWSREFTEGLDYERTHLAQMQRDPDEVFEFIWHNAEALRIPREAYGRVVSVRPCQRVAPNGAVLHETVCEFYQVLKVRASELGSYDVRKPKDMPSGLTVSLRGGCTLIFDEYGRLKYNVHNRMRNRTQQSKRLAYLWESGFYTPDGEQYPDFSRIHRTRAGFPAERRHPVEEW
jgi:hypothetical protein